MTGHAVAWFVACLSSFEREQTGFVTPTRDTVDVVRTFLVQRDFAQTLVAKLRFAFGMLVAVGVDRQWVDLFADGGLQNRMVLIAATVPIETIVMCGAFGEHRKWLQLSLLVFDEMFILMMVTAKMIVFAGLHRQ